MILKRYLFLLAVLCAVLGGLAPRQAMADEDFSFFYDNLSPYGEWIDVDGYGYCWLPDGVDETWAPYTDGYWAYTDAGWTWVSYEEFGEITYHYGRWVRVEELGWVWWPDNEWGSRVGLVALQRRHHRLGAIAPRGGVR